MLNSRAERLTRAVWYHRVLPIFRILLSGLAVFLAFSATEALVSLLSSERTGRAVTSAIITSAVTIAVYWIYQRYVEKRLVGELLLQGAIKELAMGAALGTLLLTSTIAILALLGVYRVIGTNPPTALIVPLASAITAAVFEEILFRGIVFRIAEEALGTWLAMLLSATLFGLVHLTNPHATLLGVLAISIEAGTLLAAAFLVTRRLWFPIALHAAWNFTQGGMFGVPVSGLPGDGLLQGSLSGPTWLSGGAFGVETSIVAIIHCATAAVVLTTYAARKCQITRPPWHARSSPAK